jgi:hypothetical protein
MDRERERQIRITFEEDAGRGLQKQVVEEDSSAQRQSGMHEYCG